MYQNKRTKFVIITNFPSIEIELNNGEIYSNNIFPRNIDLRYLQFVKLLKNIVPVKRYDVRHQYK